MWYQPLKLSSSYSTPLRLESPTTSQVSTDRVWVGSRLVIQCSTYIFLAQPDLVAQNALKVAVVMLDVVHFISHVRDPNSGDRYLVSRLSPICKFFCSKKRSSVMNAAHPTKPKTTRGPPRRRRGVSIFLRWRPQDLPPVERPS